MTIKRYFYFPLLHIILLCHWKQRFMHKYSLYNFIYFVLFMLFCKMVVLLPFNQPKFGKHQMCRCMYHFQVQDKYQLPSHASALLQKAIPSGWPCICVLCICRDLTANAPHLRAIHTRPAVLLINWALCARFFSLPKYSEECKMIFKESWRWYSRFTRWWSRKRVKCLQVVAEDVVLTWDDEKQQRSLEELARTANSGFSTTFYSQINLKPVI